MKYVNKGLHVNSPAGLKVAVALDAVWARKIAKTLNELLEQVGILKEISEMVARLNEHMLVRSWTNEETKVLVDRIRELVTKASSRLQISSLD